MILDRDAETSSRADLQRLQLERLQQTVARCYHAVGHYREALDALGLGPESIRSLDDLRNFSFPDVSAPYRVKGLAGQVQDLHARDPSRRDLATWARLMARSLAAAGMRPGDRLHNAYGYGLFTGGLGFHYGAEELGAMVTPASGGMTQRQVMLIQDFGATALGCTPSYALNIAEEGVDLRASTLRTGVFGAEPWSEAMRDELEARLGIDACDMYGLSEVMGPGVAIECVEAKSGLHVFEDHFIVECVEPGSGEPVEPGCPGELVFTSLTKEAFPVLRYRTRDISVLDTAPCRCGRSSTRIRRVSGRTDDMLIIRGVNVFPSQLEAVLMRSVDLAPFYQLEILRRDQMDQLRINVEAGPQLAGADDEALRRVAARLRRDIKDFVGISVEVAVRERGQVPRSQGKAVRVVDRRPAPD